MSGRSVPKKLRDLTVAIGGAATTGLLYCVAAKIATGTVGLSSVTHGVIFLGAVVLVMVPTVMSIVGERRADEETDFEERRA